MRLAAIFHGARSAESELAARGPAAILDTGRAVFYT
jgi:hypothetical protein